MNSEPDFDNMEREIGIHVPTKKFVKVEKKLHISTLKKKVNTSRNTNNIINI